MNLPILICALSFLAPKASEGDVSQFGVLPSATDPAINTFDTQHTVFVDSKVAPRNELVVFLPGTNGHTLGTTHFCSTAAELGYQVIDLMYPDTISATTVRNSADPNAFLNFRLEIIEGRDLSPAVEVNRANSVENRLVKLLLFLSKNRPTEGWSRYLNGSGQPVWEKIVISGHSQGAGHAALIAIRHKVARAVLFGGPKDYDRHLNKPAAWYTTPATPTGRFFNFNHEQDHQGCDLKEQLEICHVMGMDKFGGAANVDTTASPYNHSHILTTNYPGTRITSIMAHTSVSSDRTTPPAKGSGFLFEPVWRYMLTAAEN